MVTESEKVRMYETAKKMIEEDKGLMFISPIKMKQILEEIGRLRASLDYIEFSFMQVKQTNEKADNG